MALNNLQKSKMTFNFWRMISGDKWLSDDKEIKINFSYYNNIKI